jgi:hypothetical protein
LIKYIWGFILQKFKKELILKDDGLKNKEKLDSKSRELLEV